MPSFKPICRAKGKVGDAGGMVAFDRWKRTAFRAGISRQWAAIKGPQRKEPRVCSSKALTIQAAALKLV